MNKVGKSATRLLADRDHELAVRALALYRQGHTFRKVAEEIERSPAFAHKLVRRELEESAARRRDFADAFVEEIIDRQRWLISEASMIVTSACTRCARLPQSESASCTACDGSGYRFPPRTRLTAIDTIRRCDEVLARLAGGVGVRVDVTLGSAQPADDLAEMSGRELDEYLSFLNAPLRSLSPEANGTRNP